MQKPAILVTAAVLAVLAALSAGAASAVPPPHAAGEEPATCRGLPATIVGSPGQAVEGTPRADVIVTNGARLVESGAGDDVICTTNTPPDRGYADAIKVLSGPGDDVVDRSGDPDPAASSLTFLDDGEDSYVGGPAVDAVNSTDAGADTIDTGAGDDRVSTGYVDGWGPTGADVVDLGEGEDLFSLSASGDNVTPGLTFTGGPGDDNLRISARGAGHWVLDAASREATFRQAPAFEFGEMESYTLYTQSPRTSGFRFVGTDADESVSMFPAQAADGADLAGGDDVVLVGGPVSARRAPSAQHPFDGGAGVDRVEAPAVRETVRLSLAGGRLDFRFDNAGNPDYVVLGFEDARVVADRARIAGDAGPNAIAWNVCRATVRGGSGDDTVSWHRTYNPRCAGNDRRVYGNGGDDLLLGGPYDDVLLGGPGQDEARGRAGRDLCQAEATATCELE